MNLTRREPVVSLEQTSEAIARALDQDELDVMIANLQTIYDSRRENKEPTTDGEQV